MPSKCARGDDQRLLRFEMRIKALSRGTGPLHDRIDTRGVDAARVDQRFGRVEQPVAYGWFAGEVIMCVHGFTVERSPSSTTVWNGAGGGRGERRVVPMAAGGWRSVVASSLQFEPRWSNGEGIE